MNIKQTALFAVFAIIFILSTYYAPYSLSWLVKILPMLILIFITLKQSESTTDKLFLTGLIFSMAGDFFLDYDRVNWFIFGLVSFLTAHLFYLMCLWPVERKRLVAVIFYPLFGIAMFSIITPGLGELFVPVVAYMSILLFMGIFTVISKKSNLWLIIGGVSFIISDSLLAFDKFYTPIAYSHVLIMVTYYFAQFSLVKGVFKNRSKI